MHGINNTDSEINNKMLNHIHVNRKHVVTKSVPPLNFGLEEQSGGMLQTKIAMQ